MKSLEEILREKHHVIVQLNKETTQDGGHHKILQGPIKIRKSDPFIGQDYNVLLINRNNNNNNNPVRLNFDCVCNGFDGRARYEIDMMMDELLSHQQNCCMIRCSIYKENSTALLNYMLLTEITKHLQKNHFVIREINCEYYDVRKFNVVNMFGNEKSMKRFQGPLDLHKWLNNEYQQLTVGCQGNECLDLQFVYNDRIHRRFNVKFSYMHIILSKLDLDSKAALINCLLSVNKHYTPQGNNSLLVDTIRDYLGKNNQMRIWLFLSLPVKKPITDIMEDMIKIACAASEGFTLKNVRSKQNLLLYDDIRLTNIDNESNLSDFGKMKGEVMVKAKPMVPPNNLKEYTGRVHLWYDKINDQYDNVLHALQSYYDKKYEIRMHQLCTDIHDIINYDELGINQLDRLCVRGAPAPTSSSKVSPRIDELNHTISEWSLQLLHNLLMEYHEAVGDFRLMIEEIGKTNYESLKAYLRTKTHALRRFSLEHKLKKLREIQNEMQQTINEENKIIMKNLRSNF